MQPIQHATIKLLATPCTKLKEATSPNNTTQKIIKKKNYHPFQTKKLHLTNLEKTHSSTQRGEAPRSTNPPNQTTTNKGQHDLQRRKKTRTTNQANHEKKTKIVLLQTNENRSSNFGRERNPYIQ